MHEGEADTSDESQGHSVLSSLVHLRRINVEMNVCTYQDDRQAEGNDE